MIKTTATNTSLLQDLLPYAYLKLGACVHKDLSVSYGMEIIGVSDESFTHDIYDHFQDYIKGFLNNLRTASARQFYRYQVCYKIDSDYRNVVDYLKTLKPTVDIVKFLLDERIKGIEKCIAERSLRKVRTYFFIYLKPPREKLNFLKRFSKKKIKNNLDQYVNDTIQGLKHHAQTLKRVLEGTPFRLEDLAEEDYVNIFYEHLNPNRIIQSSSRPKANGVMLDRAIALSDLFIAKDYVNFDDYYHRIVSLHTLPETSYPTIINQLLNLRTAEGALFSNFEVTVNFELPEQTKEINKIKRKRIIASGGIQEGFKSDIESQVQLNQTGALLQKMMVSGEKIFNMSMHVRVYSKNPDEVNSMVDSVVAAFSRMEGAVGYVERFSLKSILLGILPGSPTDRTRLHKTTSTNLADFMPFYRPYEGSKRPAVIFENRHQGLAFLDLYDSALINQNVLMVGGSGAGKSFAFMCMLFQQMAQDLIFRIIDSAKVGGGSYYKATKMLNGSYVSINIDSPLTINCFDIKSEKPTPTEIYITSNKIEAMIAGMKEESVPPEEKGDIEQYVRRTFERVEKPILSDFYKICENESIKKRLFMWIRPNTFGNLTDGHTNVNIKGKHVVFDLKNLQRFKELQRVILLSIVSNIWNTIDEYQASIKIIALDEAWDLIKSSFGASMIDENYRTLRKAGGISLAITQSMADIVESPIRAAVMINTSTFIICKQVTDGDARLVARELNLNDAEKYIIQNLRVVPGKFAEIFVYQLGAFGKRSGVVRISPSAREYWTFTSDHDDANIFEEYRKRHPEESLVDIINRLAQDYPNGARK